MFSKCYFRKISRFARNDKLLGLFTKPSSVTILQLIISMTTGIQLNSDVFKMPVAVWLISHRTGDLVH